MKSFKEVMEHIKSFTTSSELLSKLEEILVLINNEFQKNFLILTLIEKVEELCDTSVAKPVIKQLLLRWSTNLEFKKIRLAIIGRATKAFSEGMYKRAGTSNNFKFLFFKDATGTLCLLIHLEERPTELHYDALQYYLMQRNIDYVSVRGGGYALFYEDEIRFTGASGDFGYPSFSEILLTVKSFWPEFKLLFIKEHFFSEGLMKENEVSCYKGSREEEKYRFDSSFFNVIEFEVSI